MSIDTAEAPAAQALAAPCLDVIADLIVDALQGDEPDHEAAQRIFADFAATYPDRVSEMETTLAAWTAPEPGVVTVGAAALVFGDPTRSDWAWRCGVHHPCTGVNYGAANASLAAARIHAAAAGATIRELWP